VRRDNRAIVFATGKGALIGQSLEFDGMEEEEEVAKEEEGLI
jgi:hypothetical protein